MHFERALRGEGQWAIDAVKFLARSIPGRERRVSRGSRGIFLIFAILRAGNPGRSVVFVFPTLFVFLSALFFGFGRGHQAQRGRVDGGHVGRGRRSGGRQHGRRRQRDGRELQLVGVVDLDRLVVTEAVVGQEVGHADDVEGAGRGGGSDVHDVHVIGGGGGRGGSEDGPMAPLDSSALQRRGAGGAAIAVAAAVVAAGGRGRGRFVGRRWWRLWLMKRWLVMWQRLILRYDGREWVIGAEDGRVGGGGGHAGDLLVDGGDEARGVVGGNFDVENGGFSGGRRRWRLRQMMMWRLWWMLLLRLMMVVVMRILISQGTQ